MENPPQTPPPPKPSWLKTRLVPILILLFVIAIVGGVFYLWRCQPEKIEELKGLGYLGVFLISLGLNATVVLPAGNFVAMAALAATLPPFNLLGLELPAPLAVGVIGGFAAAIGESTGYMAGYSGQAIIENKKNLYQRMERWLGRWGMLFIFAFSIAPLVFDVVGLVAGALRYAYWKFFVACALGRTVLYVVIAYAAVLGWEWIINIAG